MQLLRICNGNHSLPVHNEHAAFTRVSKSKQTGLSCRWYQVTFKYVTVCIAASYTYVLRTELQVMYTIIDHSLFCKQGQ